MQKIIGEYILHGLVNHVCNYARFLGYLGLIVVTLSETRTSEDHITEGSASSRSKSSGFDPLRSKPSLAF